MVERVLSGGDGVRGEGVRGGMFMCVVSMERVRHTISSDQQRPYSKPPHSDYVPKHR